MAARGIRDRAGHHQPVGARGCGDRSARRRDAPRREPARRRMAWIHGGAHAAGPDRQPCTQRGVFHRHGACGHDRAVVDRPDHPDGPGSERRGRGGDARLSDDGRRQCAGARPSSLPGGPGGARRHPAGRAGPCGDVGSRPPDRGGRLCAGAIAGGAGAGQGDRHDGRCRAVRGRRASRRRLDTGAVATDRGADAVGDGAHPVCRAHGARHVGRGQPGGALCPHRADGDRVRRDRGDAGIVVDTVAARMDQGQDRQAPVPAPL